MFLYVCRYHNAMRCLHLRYRKSQPVKFSMYRALVCYRTFGVYTARNSMNIRSLQLALYASNVLTFTRLSSPYTQCIH